MAHARGQAQRERERQRGGWRPDGGPLCRWRNYVDIIAKKWPSQEAKRQHLKSSSRAAPAAKKYQNKINFTFIFGSVHFVCGLMNNFLALSSNNNKSNSNSSNNNNTTTATSTNRLRLVYFWLSYSICLHFPLPAGQEAFLPLTVTLTITEQSVD